MDLNYVKEFLALSKTDSYYNAAHEMYISTSTLSKHIRTLEDELGVDLFDHTKRTVQLTSFGQAFCKYAEKMADWEEEYRHEVETLKNNQRKILVGAMPPQVEYNIVDVIERFEEQQHTSGCVEIVEGSSRKLFDLLNRDHLKMIFTENGDYDFNIHGEYTVVNYLQDSMCIVLPASHPLAERGSLSVSELKEETFVTYAPGNRAYETFLSICRSAGFEPDPRYIAYRANDILDMVARGRGVAIVKKKPAMYYLRLYPSLRLLDCEPEIPVNIDFEYKKDMIFTGPEKRFVEFVTQETRHAAGNEISSQEA